SEAGTGRPDAPPRNRGRPPRRACVSDAARRLGQPGVLARLLGGTVGEQLVQVLAVALVLAELLADRLGQHANRRRDLVLLVILAQEVDYCPGSVGQIAVGDLGHLVGDFLVPVVEVGEVAFLVGLVGLAVDFKCHLRITPVASLINYNQAWTRSLVAARSTN